jgi:hypothetical protein
MTIDPMQSAHRAPRCKATSKRTGKPCRAPAVRGWGVCRMHGAGGGGPSGRANGNYRHGGEPRELRVPFATSMRWQGKLATAFKEAARRSSSAAVVPRTSRRPSFAHPDM